MIDVSVVIPSYGSNTDPCRAVNSALLQKNINVEVIVVDDNGEGTKQQIENQEKFQHYAGDSRFVYIIHDKNKGGSAARNTAVKYSHGEYLCFLDDDDELSDPCKLCEQVKEGRELDETWAGTYSSCKIFKGDAFVKMVDAQKSGNILYEYVMDEVRIETASPVIRRTAYDAINGFDETFKRHQDWEFFARLLDIYKLKAISRVYYNRYYKIDAKHKTHEQRLEYMDKYILKMKACIKSLNQKQMETFIKKKYQEIAFTFFHAGKFIEAFSLLNEHKFKLRDYVALACSAINYVYRRLIYGTHF